MSTKEATPEIELEGLSSGDPSNRRRSPDSPNSGENGGLWKSLNPKTWFEAVTWSTSQHTKGNPPPSANGGQRVQETGFKPLSKVARDAVEKHGKALILTDLGPRKPPRRRFPLRPTATMIQNARRGILTRFLKQGEIVQGVDYGEIVNPTTAELRFREDLDFGTEHLSDEDESMEEGLKNKENLYYISEHRDELPTYHFWRRATDPDPLAAPKPVDWEAVFEERLPAFISEEQKGDGPLKVLKWTPSEGFGTEAPTRTVENDWMPGHKYYTELNPKRSVRPASAKHTGVTKKVVPTEVGWTAQGSIANLVWNTSHNGITEGSRLCGPQPGDPEWERGEEQWEAKLQSAKSLKEFLAQYKQDESAKYAELTAPPTSPKLRPIPGSDAGTQSYNAVLKTAVPTVAFKLTQQQFGRPVNPLKGNEPLCRNEDPTNWDPEKASRETPRFLAKTVYHQEKPLRFLDYYNEKSYGRPMLRRPERTRVEDDQREAPYRAPVETPREVITGKIGVDVPSALSTSGLKNAFADSKKPDTYAPRTLLQGDVGGLYLYDTSYDSFLATSKRVLPWIASKVVDLQIFVDIKRAGATELESVHLDLRKNQQDGRPVYDAKIKPVLGDPACEFRIRHDFDAQMPFIADYIDGECVKLNHQDIGYYWLGLKWLDAKWGAKGHKGNNDHMMYAIDFFYPEEKRTSNRYTLVLPGKSSYDINLLNGDAAVKPRTQAKFYALQQEHKDEKDPVEVQIYEVDESLSWAGDTPQQGIPVHTNITGLTGIGGSTYPPTNIPQPPAGVGSKVLIIRPARSGVVELAAPFTAKKIIDQVKELYKPLGQTWSLRVFPTEMAYQEGEFFMVSDNVESNLEAAGSFEEEFASKIEPNGNVYIYKELTGPVRVNNGTNPGSPSRDWNCNDDLAGAGIADIASEMLGVRPDKDTTGIRLRVRKHTVDGEDLYWNSTMSVAQFRTDVYYKIDDPEIDIYPRNTGADESTYDEKRIQAEKEAERISQGEKVKNPPKPTAEPHITQEENEAQWRKEWDTGVKSMEDREASRLQEETIYGTGDGEIKVPRFGPSLETEIPGRLDIPSAFVSGLTLHEIEELQNMKRRAENELLQREKTCRICATKFTSGVADMDAHYEAHRQNEAQRCPFCEGIWNALSMPVRCPGFMVSHFSSMQVDLTKQRIDHIREHHRLVPEGQGCPDCGINLHNRAAFGDTQSIITHLSTHQPIQPAPAPAPAPALVFCDFPKCRANLSHLNDKDRAEHRSTHPKKPVDDSSSSSSSSEDGGDGGTKGKGNLPGNNPGAKGGKPAGTPGTKPRTGTGGTPAGTPKDPSKGGEKPTNTPKTPSRGGKRSTDTPRTPSKGAKKPTDTPKTPSKGGTDTSGTPGTKPTPGKGGTKPQRFGSWLNCPVCAKRFGSNTQAIIDHAKQHNIPVSAFIKMEPDEIKKVKDHFNKKGHLPSPNGGDDGGKNDDGKDGGGGDEGGKDDGAGDNGGKGGKKGGKRDGKRKHEDISKDDGKGDDKEGKPETKKPEKKKPKITLHGPGTRKSKRTRRSPQDS